MRTPHLLYMLLLPPLFVAACGARQTIPERKLVKVLADMHMVDGALEQSGFSAAQLDTTAVYTAILSEHGYTVEQLYGSMKVHSRSKLAADKLYGKVCTRLDRQQAQYANAAREDKRRRWREQKPAWCFHEFCPAAEENATLRHLLDAMEAPQRRASDGLPHREPKLLPEP